ncbi:M20/M25/M40 family metallo-hydrolase [Caulobacter sp. 17J80-11]|uniref:M20/M25/M40 family metallo-hydrolase n=1 Tax=Caulobacter sp. 17J80-11 TaxID=2763502 RepID=UPI00351C1667
MSAFVSRLALALAAGAVLAVPVAEAKPKKTAPAAAAAPAPLPYVETASQLRDKAMQGSIAYSLVEEITTRFGPRPAGGPAERSAAEWGAQELKKLGFTNVEIQDFPLHTWVRGAEHGEIVAPFPQPLVITALGGSPATPAGGIEAEAVLFDTYQALLDAPKGSLTGKIAVVLQPMARVTDGAGYGPISNIRSNGPEAARERGAIAFVLRSAGTEDHRFPHTGSTKRVEGGIPAFAVSPPDAEQLARVAARGGPVKLRLYSEASSPAQIGRSQNVVAEIRGRERPDEVIVIGGHLDSWDKGTGAIDDASGVAITTAAAKLIAELPQAPKRTIRVVWFGSEELSQPFPLPGLSGGNAYANMHKDSLGKHVAASESDFGADVIYSFGLPAGAPADFAKTAAQVLAPIKVIPSNEPGEGGGPDIGPMAKLGVPAFRLNQDGSDYFDVHHTPDDVIDRVDPKSLDQNVAAWAALLWLIADSDVDFRNAAPAPAAGH